MYYKVLTLYLGVSASAGTGIYISTSFAVERLLNWPLACKESYEPLQWNPS